VNPEYSADRWLHEAHEDLVHALDDVLTIDTGLADAVLPAHGTVLVAALDDVLDLDAGLDHIVSARPRTQPPPVTTADVVPAGAAEPSRRFSVSTMLIAALVTVVGVLMGLAVVDDLNPSTVPAPAGAVDDGSRHTSAGIAPYATSRMSAVRLAELVPESGAWDSQTWEVFTSVVSGMLFVTQAAAVSACSAPRVVSYTLPPGVKRVAFTVGLAGDGASAGLAVAVRIIIDDAELFSRTIQVGSSHEVDTRSVTDPRRFTIAWAVPGSSNSGVDNCAPRGHVVLRDATLYR
jgi:hypothetical protein